MGRTVYRGGIFASAFAVVLAVVLASAPASAQDVPVPEPDVAAYSAIVVDASTGEVLYDRDAQLRLPPASLTKIFTALVALEMAPLDHRMTVDAGDLVGEASMGLVDGENLSFETLLHGLLLPSGNDAAMTIARNLGGGDPQAFVDRENARIAELGLRDTALINPHGLDAHLHYSSARDLAAVTMYALRTQPDFARVSGSLDYSAEGHELYQTNDLHVTYPGLIAGKTGVTDEAGYCLMEAAVRDGRTVITVLLGSTAEAWYADAEQLLNYGFAALAIPGRLPATDVISVGAAATAPVPVTVAVESQSQSATGVVSEANALQVVPVGQGTSLVNEPSIVDATRRSPWLWLALPFVAVPGVLYALYQFSQFGARSATRRAEVGQRGMAASEAHAPWNSVPFAVAPQYSLSVVEAESDHDLQLIWDRATRERLLRGRPSLNVSIGD